MFCNIRIVVKYHRRLRVNTNDNCLVPFEWRWRTVHKRCTENNRLLAVALGLELDWADFLIINTKIIDVEFRFFLKKLLLEQV